MRGECGREERRSREWGTEERKMGRGQGRSEPSDREEGDHGAFKGGD